MKKKMILVLTVLCACVAGFSAWRAFSILRDYREGIRTYDSLKENYRVSETSAKTGSADTDASEQETNASELAEPEKADQNDSIDYSDHEIEGSLSIMQIPLDYILTPQYDFDLESLAEVNSDVCGWIIVPGTNIDYPVVRSADNADYLRKAADGTSNNCGSIFVDFRIDDPFHQSNTIIYGHNQRNARMFHDLLKYEDEEFAREHPYADIYEADGTHHLYQVFAVCKTVADSPIYTPEFSGDEAFQSYLNYSLTQSLYDLQVPVSTDDKVITLSTCADEAGLNRMVVQLRQMN